MKIALITGSSGLIGSQSVEFLSGKFDKIIGIDNNCPMVNQSKAMKPICESGVRKNSVKKRNKP